MALLHTTDTTDFARASETRLNWRLLLSLAGTLTFWVVAGEAALRLL